MKKEKELLEYLKTFCSGRCNAARSAKLEQVLHLSGTELRKLVNRMRRKGIPICSSRDGYYYPRNAGDVCTTIQQLEAMIAGLRAAVGGMVQSLDVFCEKEEGGDDDC